MCQIKGLISEQITFFEALFSLERSNDEFAILITLDSLDYCKHACCHHWLLPLHAGIRCLLDCKAEISKDGLKLLHKVIWISFYWYGWSQVTVNTTFAMTLEIKISIIFASGMCFAPPDPLFVVFRLLLMLHLSFSFFFFNQIFFYNATWTIKDLRYTMHNFPKKQCTN